MPDFFPSALLFAFSDTDCCFLSSVPYVLLIMNQKPYHLFYDINLVLNVYESCSCVYGSLNLGHF